MSVISRIVQVIRSNLPHGRAAGDAIPSPDGEAGSRPNRKNKAHSRGRPDGHHHRQAQDRKTRYDPQLAQYYANLEVPYGSNPATVKAAWKRLVKAYHPDMHAADAHKSQVANELVQQLNRAYEAIRKHQQGGSNV